MHRSYIPLILKSDCTVNLTFDLEVQGHILFPTTDYMAIDIKISSIQLLVYEICSWFMPLCAATVS